MQVDDLPRGRGRPKRTLMKVVKIDMKKGNLSEDLAQDRSKWRNRIRVCWDKALVVMMINRIFRFTVIM